MDKFKLIAIIILLVSVIGCNNDKVIRLYYFKSITTTPIQVNCNSIFGYHGIRKIEIADESEYSTFLKTINSLEVAEIQDEIDVRYKLTYLNDTICMDKWGGLIYNGIKMKDSQATLDYILELIIKYKHKAMKPEGEFEIPDLDFD